jgi:hypothetical protein
VIPTTLKEASKILKKAICPEDVFGDLNGDQVESLKDAFRDWARLTHTDRYSTDADKKVAHECFTGFQKWHTVAKGKVTAGKYGDRTGMSKVTVKTKTDVYEVTERIASGDLCEVYGAVNKAKKPVVLKVTRTPANNDMTANESTQLRYLVQSAPSKDLKAMRHIVTLLDSFELTQDKIKKRVNVFPRLDGYCTLQDVLDEYPEGIDVRDAAWMWNRLLTGLLVAHQAQVVHGAVIPKHFMICPSTPNAHDGILIDWSYAVRRGEKIKAICPTEKDFYPPEVFAKKPADYGVDIYMAAKVMIRLLGGTIIKDGATMPDTVPRPIKGLLKACLLAAGHRPKDVWDIFEDFEKTLKQLYGPRKFRPFAMPRPAKTT